MPRILLLLLSLWLTGSCRHEPAKVPEPGIRTRDSMLIYVMAGQSNMAGRGVLEPEDTVIDPRILMLDSIGLIVPAREPLHYFYQPGLAGLSCGTSFARELLRHTRPGTRICLIPCAVGSTSVRHWLYDSLRAVHLYSNMLARSRTAMQYGVLKGVLWHQGEQEAQDSLGLHEYAADLRALFNKFRAQSGAPEVAFFAGTLADFCIRPYKDSVNAAIMEVAGDFPRMEVISTADLSCRPDFLHFDAPAQRELGRRFATAARKYLD